MSNNSQRRGLWAVVPVKPFAQGKARLGPLLSQTEREALAGAMLRDVLAALAAAPSLAGVLTVTSDPVAAEIACAVGASVLCDHRNTGIAAALDAAAVHLRDRECDGMLVVPADVPLVTAGDVEAIVDAHGDAPSLTLVPACVDGGTNALACSPPAVVPFCYGERSFERHIAAARLCGIEPQTLDCEHLARDLDRPEDVARFLNRPSRTRSYACLVAYGVQERLNKVSVSS
jgi:2-phospho-L-lactate guanylyltransferase